MPEQPLSYPPFRWNLSSQHYLGTLIEGEVAPAYRGFMNQLLPCCSRVTAFAGDADLVFVGRSAESIFDHLSGLLSDTSWAERLTLLQFSMRFTQQSVIRLEHPEALPGMRSYLETISLDPSQLALRPRPVTFVDLVASGATFGNLVGLLHAWSKEINVEWKQVSRKIRLVGIVRKKKNSPNTWRWQQHADWRPLLSSRAIKNVSIPPEMWYYLGNDQCKVTRTYPPAYWGHEENAQPYYGQEQLMALRLAFKLFQRGQTKERRKQFAALLVQESTFKEVWLRNLVNELR